MSGKVVAGSRTTRPVQRTLFDPVSFPEQVTRYPQLRYMGSKFRLLSWIHSVFAELNFTSALDAFSGSGCVAFLMKAMGKQVVANDFLDFTYQIALATVANARHRLTADHLAKLLQDNPARDDFVERTFTGVFFRPCDLRFLDNLWSNIPCLPTKYHRALAIAAVVRSCVKRQPRGVFTVAGDPDRYKDGRRDLRLSLHDHFEESVQLYNQIVFDNGQENRASRCDLLGLEIETPDLVYMDPPDVPRASIDTISARISRSRRSEPWSRSSSWWVSECSSRSCERCETHPRKRITTQGRVRGSRASAGSHASRVRHEITVLLLGRW